MQVSGIFSGQKELLSDGKKYSEEIDKDGIESHISVLKIALFCNDAFIENPDEPLEKWIIRGPPTEKALLLAGIQAGLDKKELYEAEPKIEERLFDPGRKFAASLYRLWSQKNIGIWWVRRKSRSKCRNFWMLTDAKSFFPWKKGKN